MIPAGIFDSAVRPPAVPMSLAAVEAPTTLVRLGAMNDIRDSTYDRIFSAALCVDADVGARVNTDKNKQLAHTQHSIQTRARTHTRSTTQQTHSLPLSLSCTAIVPGDDPLALLKTKPLSHTNAHTPTPLEFEGHLARLHRVGEHYTHARTHTHTHVPTYTTPHSTHMHAHSHTNSPRVPRKK